jgi:hypothetical protein
MFVVEERGGEMAVVEKDTSSGIEMGEENDSLRRRLRVGKEGVGERGLDTLQWPSASVALHLSNLFNPIEAPFTCGDGVSKGGCRVSWRVGSGVPQLRFPARSLSRTLHIINDFIKVKS